MKRHVGYLPDSPIFYDYLRGREILEFIGEMHGQSRGEAQRRAEALLAEFALGDASEEFAVNYSMGMKKKLGLACALIHDPSVLVLDEPTNGLDPRASHDVQERLRHSATGRDDFPLDSHLLDMAQAPLRSRRHYRQEQSRRCGPLDELQERLDPGGTLEEVFLKVTDGHESDGSVV